MYDRECAEAQSHVARAYSICEQIQQRHINALKEAKEEYERMMKQTKEDYEALSQESNGLKERIQKQEAMIVLGKAQLNRLNTLLTEANMQTAAAKKESEMVITKNGQLTRELFLLRRVRM